MFFRFLTPPPSGRPPRLVAERHIGLLPVVDDQGRPLGVVRLADLLSLELPDFLNLLPDVDFVHDFGAVETDASYSPRSSTVL